MKMQHILPSLLLSLGACGGGSEPPAATVAPKTTTPAQQTPADAAPPAAASRDLSTIKACELVKGSDVARIAQGTLLQDSGGGHPFCMYVVEVANDIESYKVAYAEPAPYQALMDYERGDANVEVIPGHLDAAYLKPEEMGAGFVFIAVRKGDLAVEVKGPRKEPTLEIAKIAIGALP